jgi:hypothetical protein
MPEQANLVCLLFLESRCEKHRLMIVVAKDVKERTTSAPRVNERKQTGTQNFNTRDYKCRSHCVAGYRHQLSCYVKEIHLMVRLIDYTACDMARDFICGYFLSYLLITYSLTYILTHLLNYLLTHLLTYLLTHSLIYILTHLLT